MDAPETLVWEDANARAFAVVAPRRGTVWVAPRRRRARIGELTDDECRSIGEGLRTVARAMDAAWDDPDFNLVAHSAALGATERFQAYFEVAPHRREDASLGSLQYDVPISHLPPEQCAAELNSVGCYPNPRHWIPTLRSRGTATLLESVFGPEVTVPFAVEARGVRERHRDLQKGSQFEWLHIDVNYLGYPAAGTESSSQGRFWPAQHPRKESPRR